MALDNFDRANSSTLGSQWTTDVRAAGDSSPQIISNTASSTTLDVFRSAWWNGITFGPDVEITATIADWETATNQYGISFYARLTDPGTATFDGYQGAFVNDSTSGTNDVAVISRWNNGVQSFLAFPACTKHLAGDVIRLSCVGAVITLSRFRTATWTDLATTTDVTPLTTAGYVGMFLHKGPMAIDDFDVPGAPVTAGLAWYGV